MKREENFDYKYVYSDFGSYDRIRAICDQFVHNPFREDTPEIYIYWDAIEQKYVIRLGMETTISDEDFEDLEQELTYQH